MEWRGILGKSAGWLANFSGFQSLDHQSSEEWKRERKKRYSSVVIYSLTFCAGVVDDVVGQKAWNGMDATRDSLGLQTTMLMLLVGVGSM